MCWDGRRVWCGCEVPAVRDCEVDSDVVQRSVPTVGDAHGERRKTTSGDAAGTVQLDALDTVVWPIVNVWLRES